MNQSGLVVAPGSRRVDSGAHEGIPVEHAFLPFDLVNPVGKESLHIDAAAVIVCPADHTHIGDECFLLILFLVLGFINLPGPSSELLTSAQHPVRMCP